MCCLNKASDTQAGGQIVCTLTVILYEILFTLAIKRLVIVNIYEIMAINLNTDKIYTYNKFV
jgi:hypothetical protein